jgi:AcrR family transcriptional regulator
MTIKGPHAPCAQTGNEVSHSLSEERLEQVLKAAERRFATSGLASTTTIGVAKAAGISEAMLYLHFATKQTLFQEVLKRNSQDRLAALRERFFSIPELPRLGCIESMAESTVLACVEEIGNASIMAWGLMEMPEYAADIYRVEIGATEVLWNAETGKRFGDPLVRSRLAVHVVPYAVHTCMAFGFWLTTLRHKPATAQAHARQYAGGIVDAARAVLNFPPELLETPASCLPAQREFVGNVAPRTTRPLNPVLSTL